MDNKPQALRELALFAGAGGGILGGKLLGWETICAVEFNAYARSVLLARQNDRTLAPFPIWDDVRTFDGKPWRGLVDVVSGGFPCQDISAARSNSKDNGKQLGLDGEKSGLWTEQARIVRECEPYKVQVENSPRLSQRGLDRVLWDLAEMGFYVEWCVLSAGSYNAPHERERKWIVATHPDRAQRERRGVSSGIHPQYQNFSGNTWWKDKPRIHGVDDGVACRVDRLKAIGNGQVPVVAAASWGILNAST